MDDDSSSRRSSDYYPVKFTKKKQMAVVDWNTINRKLEANQKESEIQLDTNDLLYSMFDENPSDRYKRESMVALDSASIKKLKNMVKKKRDRKGKMNESLPNHEALDEFQNINDILEKKLLSKEKEIEKLCLDHHKRQK